MRLTSGIHNPTVILASDGDFWRVIMETVQPLITVYSGGPGSRTIALSEHSIWAPDGEWRPHTKEPKR